MSKSYSGLPTPSSTGRQPSKAIRRAVRGAFDAKKLSDICVMKDFSEYGQRVDLPGETWDGEGRFYYYKDNGSDVLGIAHLDSVQSDGYCHVIDTAAGLLAVSGTLDDRLGAYVILEMLPQLDVKCDWLLTTGEECCQSTGEDFYPKKQYNWMFQFDRGGTDVVMYDYETHELCNLVEEAGAQVGRGSFSDICQLDHLGCSGFNWGVGYEDYHSRKAHAWLDDTFRMVGRFVKFYRANATLALEYTPSWRKSTGLTPSDDDLEEWFEADCGHDIDVNNPDTYVEEGTSYIVCRPCGVAYHMGGL